MTPRRLAVKALIHQEQAGYANLVLDAELKKCDPPMNTRDAAFAARIFYTTLERLPLLDYRINQFTKKPVAKLDAPVRAVLRAGLAQALYMNVPLPAAVNESVKLTRALGKSSAAGMVNAVLRRSEIPEDTHKRLTFDKLIIDLDSYELIVDGKKIDTPPKEMELLYHLAATPNRVYTRNQLLDEVWGFDYFGDSRTVDVHIKRLREKLEKKPAEPEYIMTKWGVGYYFKGEEQPTV